MTDQYLACPDCVYSRCGGPVNTFFARLTGTKYGWHCRLVTEPGDFNRATGTQEPDQFVSCSVERGKYGTCGPTAQNWTPRRRRDLVRLLGRP